MGKNFLYNLVYQIVALIIPIITVPYVSRVLGAEALGVYTYTLAYIQYFIIIGMIGISLYGNRQIAYNKKNKRNLSKEFWGIYYLQLITTFISFLLYILIFVVLNKNNKILYLIQGLMLVSSMFDISWFFIGYEDMKSVVLRNIIFKILGVVAIFIFVKDITNLNKYALIMAGSIFLGQVVMWLNLKEKVIFYKPKLENIKKHFRPAMALLISQLAIQVYVLLDKTMLGLITDATQVGLYDGAQKVIRIALTIITSLGVVMMPRMSNLYSEGKLDELKALIYKAFNFVNVIAIPTVIGIILISDTFALWFYGDGFNGVNILLQIGSIMILFIGWSNILGIQVMLPMKMEKEFTKSVMCGAVINLGCNLFLITGLKSTGTIISSVIAEFVVTCVQFYFLRDFIKINRVLKSIMRPILGTIIMGVILVFIIPKFEVSVVSTLLQVIIGGGIYLIVLFLLKEPLLKEVVKTVKRKNKI